MTNETNKTPATIEMQATSEKPVYMVLSDLIKRDQWDAIRHIVRKLSPSGSGFDSGTTLADKSTENKLIFETAYHHMNSVGFYDGWTEHKVTIAPDFLWEYDIRISGRNKNQIKDFIGDVFQVFLAEKLTMEFAHETRQWTIREVHSNRVLATFTV